jgi:RNA polymerase sigma factor (sigma-70 family)
MVGGGNAARVPDVAVLYARHRGVMYRTAAAYLRSRGVALTVADDAVAEVVRRLLQNGVSADLADDDWEAYLVRAALNAAKDEIKKMTRRPDKVDVADDMRLTRAGLADSRDVEEEVMEAVDRERALRRVHSALKRLPSLQHSVVVGRHLHGRTNADIAADLGVTAGRVSQLYTAGIRALAALLASESP